VLLCQQVLLVLQVIVFHIRADLLLKPLPAVLIQLLSQALMEDSEVNRKVGTVLLEAVVSLLVQQQFLLIADQPAVLNKVNPEQAAAELLLQEVTLLAFITVRLQSTTEEPAAMENLYHSKTVLLSTTELAAAAVDG
jgi:hypothetical protein